jgi:hypothetical protein
MRMPHPMSCRGEREQWRWASNVALTSTPDRTFDQLVRESVLARRNWIDEEFAKNNGRQPESADVLPI